jgi:hypothetical protein
MDQNQVLCYGSIRKIRSSEATSLTRVIWANYMSNGFLSCGPTLHPGAMTMELNSCTMTWSFYVKSNFGSVAFENFFYRLSPLKHTLKWVPHYGRSKPLGPAILMNLNLSCVMKFSWNLVFFSPVVLEKIFKWPHPIFAFVCVWLSLLKRS